MTTKGGVRRGAGRPRKSPEEKARRVIVSMTPEQHEFLKARGGPSFLRDLLKDEIDARTKNNT